MNIYIYSYIEILNAEHPKEDITSKTSQVDSTDTKKVEELERTVFIMKRVVEKLQTENKKLLSGKRPISERVVSNAFVLRIHFFLRFLTFVTKF